MPLGLEEFARIQAAIDAGSDRGAALAAAAVDDAGFRAAKLEWLDAMATGLERGDGSLVQRYAAAYATHTPPKSDARVAPPPGDLARPPTLAAGDAGQGEPSARREVLVPSFLAPAAAPTANAIPVQLGQARPHLESGPMGAASARPLGVQPASHSIPVAGAAPPVPPTADPFGATGFVDRDQLLAGLKLPFREDASPNAAASTPSSGLVPPAAAGKAAPAPAVGTGTEAISRDDLLRAITPFLDQRPAAPAVSPPLPASAASAANAAPPPPAQAETAGISPADIARALMPFQAQAAANAAPAPPPARAVDPRIDTGTAAIGRSEIERVLQSMKAGPQGAASQAALPTPAPSSPAPAGAPPPTVFLPNAPPPAQPGMPLAEYARITATLTRENDPPATFRRLGIDMVMWMSTVRQYAQMFREDPALERAFQTLVDQSLGRR